MSARGRLLADLLSVRGRREVSNRHDFDTAELELEHQPLLYSLVANVKIEREESLACPLCYVMHGPHPNHSKMMAVYDIEVCLFVVVVFICLCTGTVVGSAFGFTDWEVQNG